MLHYKDPAVRPYLFDGCFGLEKESQRITRQGKLSASPHPELDKRIVRDFGEAQSEINTGVHTSLSQTLEESAQLTRLLEEELEKRGELLWVFSSPPRIDDSDDIRILQGDPKAREYREYLTRRYGRRIMTFCGIHYNFSFGAALMEADRALSQEADRQSYYNRVYLDLCAKLVKYGWILNVLMDASPVVDGSLWSRTMSGRTCFTGMSSMRNSELGYWNPFTPILDYSDMNAYTASIEKFVQEGLLKAPRELYYPVRIKPDGAYDLDLLRQGGASHIELRMLDLNPYELSGLNEQDAQFIHLFLVWLACIPDLHLSQEEQMLAVHNYKNAAHYDPFETPVSLDGDTSISAAMGTMVLLQDMKDFFLQLAPEKIVFVEAQIDKLMHPRKLYSRRVVRDFVNFAQDGLLHSLEYQRKILQK